MQGHSTSIDRYLGLNKLKSGFSPRCRLDRFEYHLFVKYYQKLFGRENVHVLLIEQLKESRQEVCNNLGDFLGMKRFEAPATKASRVGLTGTAIIYKRFCNRYGFGIPDWTIETQPLSTKIFNKIGNIINKMSPSMIDQKIESQIKDKIDMVVRDKFSKSNQKLAKLTGIELKKYGYC